MPTQLTNVGILPRPSEQISSLGVSNHSGARLNSQLGRGSGTMSTQRTRRDATKVIYEILALGIEGVSKTQIIYKVNLSFRRAEVYIHFLANKGFLKLETDPQGLTKYWLTESGVRLLRLLRSVEIELRELFLGSP